MPLAVLGEPFDHRDRRRSEYSSGGQAVERHFEQELEQLKSKLLAMSALVESAVYHSITAVVHKDRELAEEVLQKEARVNLMQIEIDEQAIRLLALQQPMASDLRLITAAIKINTDLERMGDLGGQHREARSLLDGRTDCGALDRYSAHRRASAEHGAKVAGRLRFQG